jgi:hypothetical protein
VGPAGRPSPGGSPSGADAGACVGCGIFGIIFLFAIALSVGIAIFLAVWISKDAKARGLDNPGMWVILVLFTGWIGLIIYLVTRPQGTLYLCPDCGQKRLERSRRCPHCGSR